MREPGLFPGRFFYSGAVHVPNEYAGAAIEFKVVVHNAGADLDEPWEDLVYNPGLQDHVDLPKCGNDTTIQWFWFDNLRPVTHEDAVVVTWEADMSIVTDQCNHIDTLEVRYGYYGTAQEVGSAMMTRQGFTYIWSATDTVVTTIGGHLNYQYYAIVAGEEYREIYYNFYYEGETPGEAECRVYDPIEGSSIVIEDKEDSEDDIHRMPMFRNTLAIAQDVLVTYTCDVRSAIWTLYVCGDTLYDIQGDIDITGPEQVIPLGVTMNGPATEYGWSNGEGLPDWGPYLMELDYKRMWDDGTHGDAVAGDSIFSRQISYTPIDGDVVGQEFRFGIGGGNNESDLGFNHIENIDDAQSTSTIASQFGSINPTKYCVWGFDANRPYQMGDVDKDYSITVLDVLAAVVEILTPGTLSRCQRCLADCNRDGVVNIGDVIGVVRVLLGIGTCPPTGVAKGVASSAFVSAQPVTLNEEGDFTLPISVDSEIDIAGVQLKLGYNAGVLTPDDPQLSDRSVGMNVASKARDGELTIVVYGPEGETISAGTGPILSVRFKTHDAKLTTQDTNVRFEEVVLAVSCTELIPVEIEPIVVKTAQLPTEFALAQNYPNPFNPTTHISYTIPAGVGLTTEHSPLVTLKIFNLLGQEVRTLVDEAKEAGYYSVTWDARDDVGREVSSGIYFVRMKVGEYTAVKKMALIK